MDAVEDGKPTRGKLAYAVIALFGVYILWSLELGDWENVAQGISWMVMVYLIDELNQRAWLSGYRTGAYSLARKVEQEDQ